VEYFFIGKQKVVLFPKYRKNGWESATSALSPTSDCSANLMGIIYINKKSFYHLS
jgi:hypothetical protein